MTPGIEAMLFAVANSQSSPTNRLHRPSNWKESQPSAHPRTPKAGIRPLQQGEESEEEQEEERTRPIRTELHASIYYSYEGEGERIQGDTEPRKECLVGEKYIDACSTVHIGLVLSSS